MVDSETKWHTLLNDYYWPTGGRSGPGLTTQTAVRWWNELSSIQTSNEELCEAIRHHENQPKKQRYGKPTLEELRGWVLDYRKAHRKGKIGVLDVDESFLRGVQAQIAMKMEKRDPEGAWNCLCEPDSYCGMGRKPSRAECEYLEKWLKACFPSFERPKFTNF